MPDPVGSLSGATVLRVSDDVLTRTAGTETVLLDLDSEEFFGLDGVGARVFELFEQPRTLGDVIDTLSSEYDVDRPTLTKDVTDLVAELAAQKLLVVDG
jgi:hypothetical protein